MKKMLLPLLLICFSLVSYSQTFSWAKTLNGDNTDNAAAVAVDKAGNTYITGKFMTTIDFDPSANVNSLTSAGATDIFLAKYDKNGNYKWSLKAGNVAGDEGIALAVDASGNVLFTGAFQGNADFDPSANTLTLSALAYNDPFVAKYDSLGNLLWAFAIRGMGYDYGYGIATGTDNKVYVTGRYSKTSDFDPSANTVNLSSANNSSDVFLACYDSMGVYQWAKSMGDVSTDMPQAIALDKLDNIYITGYFADSTNMNPSGSTKLKGKADEIFLAKYTNTGNLLWAKNFGGQYNDQAFSVAVDDDNNVAIVGTFSDSLIFKNGLDIDTLVTLGSADGFVAKFDTNGNYKWANQVGSTGFDTPKDIAFNAEGSLYLTGSYNSTIDFDPSAGTNILSSNAEDAYLVKYDSLGNYVWVKTIGNTAAQTATSVAIGADNSFYLCGYYYTSIVMNGLTYNSSGQSDMFLTKYTDPLTPVQVKTATADKLAQFYPNPCEGVLNLILEGDVKEASVRIYSQSGMIVLNEPLDAINSSINVSALPAGLYVLEVESDTQIAKSLLLKK